jgi:hypothetical protein
MLKLPIWAVTEHIQTVIEPLPCSIPGKAAIFTSSDKLIAFFTAHMRGEWKATMAADRDGLIVMIADFHRAQIETLVVDPNLDGSGGQEVPLTELMSLAKVSE